MFVKLVRIGRDAELRFTNNQKPVISLACVYDIGWGDNKKAQWLDATIWGKQAEALAQYLTKGKQVVISADDVELEEFQKKDGTSGSKLKCRVINVDLTDNNSQAAPQAPAQSGFQQQAPQQQGGGFGQPSQNLAAKRAAQQAPQVNPQAPTETPYDDDIPF